MNISVVSEMRKSLGSQAVRGSYSARVPRSSFARVRKLLVSHMEQEVEEQENDKEDPREDGKQRVGGRVVESMKQPHHERMRMG